MSGQQISAIIHGANYSGGATYTDTQFQAAIADKKVTLEEWNHMDASQKQKVLEGVSKHTLSIFSISSVTQFWGARN